MRRSAGIVLWRRGASGFEVLLGHMGGPFWARKDARAWTIPKGEHAADEDPLAAALREFEEETGAVVSTDGLVDLGEARQSGGKLVRAWAVEGDLDAATAVSNMFEMEWPPKSGRSQAFPELDRFAWFDVERAAAKIVAGQRPFLDRVAGLALGRSDTEPHPPDLRPASSGKRDAIGADRSLGRRWRRSSGEH